MIYEIFGLITMLFLQKTENISKIKKYIFTLKY